MSPQTMMRQLPSYRHHGAGPLHGGLWPSYLFALLIFAVALAIRWLLDEQLPPGFPYLPFFPAVVIVCFVAGIWPGILVALLSGLAAWYLFIPPFESFALTAGSTLALAFYVVIVAVDIFLINMALNAFAESDRLSRENVKLSDHQELLIRELDHRIKNLFSVVASVVKLSSRYAETPRQLAEEVNERILALGRSHGALWREGQDGAATAQTVAGLVLEPYLTEHGNRIRIAGESPVLSIQLVQILSLIFHELATNAAKYGALQQPLGTVAISISRDEKPGDGFTIEWRESGIVAPEVEPTAGFGSELIERLVSSVGGKLGKVFAKDTMVTSVTFSSA